VSRFLPLLVGALVAFTGDVVAQAPPPADSRGEWLFGAEARRDRITYHFDNPSSFDTAVLVPHFFEQRYITDNVWGVATVRYAAGIKWETSLGATPQRTARADDYDTFFDTDGTVWVSGTTGGASIRSLRFSQRAELARLGAVTLVAGYRFRLDRADFQLGHKTITRNGVLVTAIDVTTRESASSQVHEVFVGAAASRTLNERWQLSFEGELSPTTLGRLLVQLPDKYPGQDLVFVAKGLAGAARLALMRRHPRWPIEVSADAGHIWSYHSTDRLSRDLLGVRASVGRAW